MLHPFYPPLKSMKNPSLPKSDTQNGYIVCCTVKN